MTEYIKVEKQVYDSTLRVSMERAAQLQEATKLLTESSRHLIRLMGDDAWAGDVRYKSVHKLLTKIGQFLGGYDD